MEILVLHDLEQLGHCDMIAEMRVALPQMPAFRDASVQLDYADDANLELIEKERYDAVILMDALQFYFRHRLRFQGRPWFCLVAFAGSTPLEFKKVNLPDSGIHAVLSNCLPLVSQVGSVIPSSFCWQPRALVSDVDPSVDRKSIGCVLPNVADRDFCLLDRVVTAYRHVPGAVAPAIFLSDSAKGQVPESLREFVFRYKHDLQRQCFNGLRYYVPAPRLTDYRSGVVPPDLVQAMAYGIRPLCIYHRVLAPLEPYLQMYRSLDEYDAAVAAAISTGTVPGYEFPLKSLESVMLASANTLAHTIATAYQRSRHG